MSGPTHLLLGLAVIWLQLQNPLETAAGCHGVAKGQVALALSQMALWVKYVQLVKLNNIPPLLSSHISTSISSSDSGLCYYDIEYNTCELQPVCPRETSSQTK